MPDYIPLRSNTTDTPILYFNADAPLSDLLAFASGRIRLARNLAKTHACTRVHATDDRDLEHVAAVMYGLLEDGCEVMSVVERRLIKV